MKFSSAQHHVLPAWLQKPLARVRLHKGLIGLDQLVDSLLARMKRHEIPHRAAGVAFHFTLSIFPAILFFFSLIPYVPIANLESNIFSFLANVLPQGIYQDSMDVVADIVLTKQGSILSIGLLAAMYASTAGMNELIESFNGILFIEDKRNFFKKKLLALLLTGTIAFALFFAIIVLIVGEYILEWLENLKLLKEQLALLGIQLLQYVASLLVFWISISAIYYYAPAGRRRWKFVSLGGIVASVLALVLTHLFGIYISRFATYNKLYGSIGTFMGLMLWLWLLSIVLLVGFEINASLEALVAVHKAEHGAAKDQTGSAA